ncbi:hypothetical protein J3F84DRAFT_355907 [Trichoderma pleuroticola]
MLDSSFARGVSKPSSLDFSLFPFFPFFFSFPSTFYNPSICHFALHFFFDNHCLVFSYFLFSLSIYSLSILSHL